MLKGLFLHFSKIETKNEYYMDWSDKDLVYSVVLKDGYTLQFADETLRRDRE